MSKRRSTFSSLSQRVKALLRSQEDTDVEFKQSTAALESSDITAFANSERGGAILIGVAETKDAAGHQVGQVIGCPTGDKAKLQVLDKAMSCLPPVPLEIFVENTSDKPFFRIEIPSGPDRPYATGGGVYKTREDGRVRALAPADLLRLLLEKEVAVFEQRFAGVTVALLGQLEALQAAVTEVSASIKESVDGIDSTLGWTEMKVDDTASDISSTLSLAKTIRDGVKDIEDRVVSLLSHSGAPDPVKVAARTALIDSIAAQFQKDPKLLERLTDATHVTVSGDKVVLFSNDEMSALILEAAAKARETGA
jgi:predicted HTH transcriptional regulator